MCWTSSKILRHHKHIPDSKLWLLDYVCLSAILQERFGIYRELFQNESGQNAFSNIHLLLGVYHLIEKKRCDLLRQSLRKTQDRDNFICLVRFSGGCDRETSFSGCRTVLPTKLRARFMALRHRERPPSYYCYALRPKNSLRSQNSYYLKCAFAKNEQLLIHSVSLCDEIFEKGFKGLETGDCQRIVRDGACS